MTSRAVRLIPLLLVTLLLSSSLCAKENFQKPAPVRLDNEGEKWARRSLKKMSLEQKIGQMFVIWSRAEFLNVNNPEYLQWRDAMRKYHLGGFGVTVEYQDGFLYKNEPLEAAMVTNQLQKDSEFPLIFAADFERGLGMRLNEVTGFPHAMAFGAAHDLEYARQSGRITAQEARAIGVQWNWFPDADVNSNPDNPVINTRSFGEDPEQVGRMVSAYIQGAHEYGMLTTAKHFPGHGDTDTDSHLAVPSVNADRARLDRIELPPFQAAIDAGVDAVLVGHIRVPALDPDPNHVATVSPAIVTGLLRQQMHFNGLIVTDALVMNGLMKLFPEGGANSSGRAAVQAVKAGNDILLIPSDLDGSYHGLLNAVRSGEIPESRIDQSVLKILRAKASVGLNKAKLVDINAVNQVVAKPGSLATAQTIADRAVTLVRDNHQVLPLRRASRGTNPGGNSYQETGEDRAGVVLLVFSDDTRSQNGRLFDEQMRRRIPGTKTLYLDSRNAAGMSAAVAEAVSKAGKVVVAIYEVPVAGKVVPGVNGDGNSVALQNSAAAVLQSVLGSAGERTLVVAMGNPYVISQFPGIQTYLCTFSNMKVSEISAVRAIFGEIPMTGRLPVTLPNIAARGTGLSSTAQQVSGGTE